MKWTAEDDLNLKKYSEAGYSAMEAGDMMGRTRNAVLGRAHRVGVSFKFVKDKALDTVTEAPVKNYFKEEKLTVDADAPKHLYESLLNLRHNQCRWPINTKFCDEEKSPGASYCETHLRMSYRQGGRE